MTRVPVMLSAAALVALGSTTTYLIMKPEGKVPTAPAVHDASRAPADVRSGRTPGSDVSFTLSADAVGRAGIVVGAPSVASDGSPMRVPAVVEPNAYRAVVVTPIAAGRVTSVSVELGQQVRRGQTLAQIYSPELVEAQGRYLSARSELAAHERELRRTEKLAAIGSASQQELENIHAEHTAATTMVGSLRSRLMLLGMAAAQIDALSSVAEATQAIAIPAPIDGVVTARTANVGLNVDPSMPLFTVVDLSTVWLIGDLFERDFSRVRVGSTASVTTPAYPELMLQGKVSYIDPEINPQTRTSRVRVEVPNPGRQLRLGMYAEMRIGQDSKEPQASRIAVPRTAVQVVGDRSVVYLADPNERGRFVERAVQLGPASGESVEVTSGLEASDAVVVRGSFSLRAERERLGLGQTAAAPQSAPAAARSNRVTVSEKGFEPTRIAARAGSVLRLTFVRTTDATCATEVTIPAFNITRALPLNQPVEIELTPQKSGDLEFACGMNMFKGTIVVN